MNSNWYLFIYVAFGFQLVMGEVPKIANCCPFRRVLIKYTPALLGVDRYDCVETHDVKNNSYNIELISENVGVAGFKIESQISNFNSSIPKCNQPDMIILSNSNGNNLEPNSCLITKNQTIAALTCPQKSIEEIQYTHLTILKKCCPLASIYDSVEKKCINGEINYDVFAGLFEHPVVFVNHRIDCSKNKVFVEYQLKREQIKYEHGYINIFPNGENIFFNSNQYCIDTIDGNVQKFLLRTCTDISICEKLGCIRKCCEDGEMFVKGNATSYCKIDIDGTYFHSFESLQINANFTKPEVFGIIRSLDCLKFRLDPDSYLDDAHSISPTTGSLKISSTGKTYSNKQYCIEKIHDAFHEDQKLYTFLCFDSKVVGNDRLRFKLYPIGLLISCCFYAITLTVYLSISKLRNLPGQILICLVISLLAAYLGIALGQLMPTENDNLCFASGFFVYFCLMAAFSWMNVTCFDIWQTFGSTRRKRCFKKENRKRFFIYSLYGWGLPTVLTLITLLLTKSNFLSDSIRPSFGHGRCWFTYDTLGSASLIFFSGPVGLLFLINFALFTLTLRYCNKVKKEIFRMQSSNVEKPVLRRRFFMDKARFAMNTKLFIVMGITWLLELLSIVFYDHKKTFFWAISDSFNVLLGVFVFFIFVFKKRIWTSILEIVVKTTNINGTNTRCTNSATHSTFIPQNITMTRLNSVDANLLLLK